PNLEGSEGILAFDSDLSDGDVFSDLSEISFLTISSGLPSARVRAGNVADIIAAIQIYIAVSHKGYFRILHLVSNTLLRVISEHFKFLRISLNNYLKETNSRYKVR
ncbi:MAG TPA: hypothetical protein PKK48_00930, partial [Phycisphaerae bacterium]|nr:hypothetical protein [Phycisphaerae bacterium]